jgi:hypothetical protein
MPKGQCRLDEARDTGRRVEVPHVGLERTDRAIARACGVTTKCLSESLDLKWIAHDGAGAVGLDVCDRFRIDAGDTERLGNGFGLTGDARRQVSHLALAIVVDG